MNPTIILGLKRKEKYLSSGVITNDDITFCGSKTTQSELFI